MSGSTVWFGFTKILKSAISSLISWKFFTPSCVASSFTMIGGLIVMTFFGSSSIGGATSAACPSVDETAAASVTGAGGGGGNSTAAAGATGPVFAISFEIGGKNVVLTFGTPSADFAFGLSINETDSTLLAGLGFSSVFSGVATGIRAGASFSFAGVVVRGGFSAPLAFDSLPLSCVSL